MSSFDDQCMTLYEPKAGSFASLETCDGRITQDISLTETGHIIPAMAPDLCLTLGTLTLPGGGANPLHILKSVDFQSCDDSIAAPIKQSSMTRSFKTNFSSLSKLSMLATVHFGQTSCS